MPSPRAPWVLAAAWRRRLLVGCTLLLAVASGCDDGDDHTPRDTRADDAQLDATDVSEDLPPDTAPDTPDTAPDTRVDVVLCDAVRCAEQGLVCDPQGGSDCVQPPPTCVADGEPCTVGTPVATGFVCAPRPDGSGVCRVVCDAGANPCPSLTACISGPDGSWCQPDECGSALADDCGDDARCVPVAVDIDMCVARAGTRVENAPCTWHTDCLDGICLAGRCAAPECTTRNDQVPCDSGLRCDPLRIDDAPLAVGICRATCSAFVSPSGCPLTDWCRPIQRNGDGAFSGVCVPDISPTTADNPCRSDLDCDRGLICSRGLCKRVCDPSASSGAAACDGGRDCVPFFQGLPYASDFGLCLQPCSPFDDSPCLEEEWCAINLFANGAAHCRATRGAVPEGGACFGATPSDTCQDGLICLETADCRRLCTPGAPAGSPGDTCLAGTGCAVLANAQGQPLATGYCATRCDYHGGTIGCDVDPTRPTCAMGEPFLQAFDLCLPAPRAILEPDESCTARGLHEYELCAPGGSICVARPGDGLVVCKDVCAFSEGPTGTVGHPDCRNETQTCSDVFGAGSNFGLCL